MPTTPIDALDLFYPAANAAYSANDPAHVLIGNGFQLVSQIKVDPDKAAKLPPQHLPLLTSMLKLSPVFGFVARREATASGDGSAPQPAAVMVSFRGTETPEEWLCDFEAEPKGCDITGPVAAAVTAVGTEGDTATAAPPTFGTVHEGFQKVYEVVRESALGGLAQVLSAGEPVWVTGHSLGAALAVLFAAEASSQTQNLRVCTFAGPRVGFQNFVEAYNRCVPDTTRVVNLWDRVPDLPLTLPPLFPYEHVGEALRVNGGFTLNLKQAHSLPLSYLPGLKKQTQAATPKQQQLVGQEACQGLPGSQMVAAI